MSDSGETAFTMEVKELKLKTEWTLLHLRVKSKAQKHTCKMFLFLWKRLNTHMYAYVSQQAQTEPLTHGKRIYIDRTLIMSVVFCFGFILGREVWEEVVY